MVSLMLGTLTDDLRALMHKSYRKTTRISYDFLRFLYELFELKGEVGRQKHNKRNLTLKENERPRESKGIQGNLKGS